MARDHKLSFVIPRRKSSIQALRPDPSLSRRGSVEDSTSSHANSHTNNNAKAHKILGSSEADVRQHDLAKSRTTKKISGRSGLMRISESRSGVEEIQHNQQPQQQDTTSRKPDSASNSNGENPLRQRASSPLLGNSYRTRQNSLSSLPPPPKPPTRSSSKLHSFYDMQQQPPKPASRSQGDLSLHKTTRSTKRADHTRPSDLSDVPELSGETTVKAKHRPPRIDLSMLFPKPRAQAVPLLSPQRLTNSPSPVSVISDTSPDKTHPPGNRFMKHARPRDSVRMMRQKQSEQNGNYVHPQPQRKARPREWFDGPEGDVSDDEDVPFTFAEKNSISEMVPESEPHTQTRTWGDEAENFAQSQSQISPESIGIPSITKGGKSPDSMATPTPASSITVKLQNSLQAWEFNSTNSSRSRVSSVSKKTSNSALQNSNLNESSILCLTSSEDEDEDEDPMPLNRKPSPGAQSDMTDAEAAFGACTLGRLPSAGPSRSFSRSKNTPPPSGSRPRASSNRARQRVSSIPMISEPPEDALPPLPSNPTLDIRSPEYLGRNRAPSSNRRSRVIAVTRQEESLLEVMRQRAGAGSAQPASIFSDASESTYEEPKRHHHQQPDRSYRTHRSKRSSTSAPFTDTSFLRLSTCSPSETVTSSHVVPDPGTTSFMDSDGSASYGASDTDHRTDNTSTASPRISLIHSDTIPSPSTTSVASPLTPTLPLHKFSPQPPPAEPSPSSQYSANGEGRRHSRTRTDSSTAIVLDGPDDASSKQRGRVGSTDLPVWAVGWRDDGAGLGVVH
ncbi:hypothetical protein FQN54_004623 [Arachnomyces sp. PD_36]|nr:hypothetical protein FQN54_004623 [Arachnomyces sp. PD_36]